MDSSSFSDYPEGSGREITLQYSKIMYSDNRLAITVYDIEVWRIVIIVVHLDQYAIEPTYCRHVNILYLLPVLCKEGQTVHVGGVHGWILP